MIPGSVVHHVSIWGIMEHTAEFTHGRRYLFEVKSHTILSIWNADEAAFTYGFYASSFSYFSILPDTILFRKPTWHRSFCKYEYTIQANIGYVLITFWMDMPFSQGELLIPFTLWGLVTHKCIGYLGHHLFMPLLVCLFVCLLVFFKILNIFEYTVWKWHSILFCLASDGVTPMYSNEKVEPI